MQGGSTESREKKVSPKINEPYLTKVFKSGYHCFRRLTGAHFIRPSGRLTQTSFNKYMLEYKTVNPVLHIIQSISRGYHVDRIIFSIL